MPRGITQDEVWKACDALLLEGARPTIERVRQKLGRGSPNTVSPMLETWFKHLGGRIADPGAFAAPADIPDPVLQAAKHFWEAALAQTRADFDARLAEGMAGAVANVEAEKARAALAEAAAFDAVNEASHLQVQLDDVAEALATERLKLAATDARATLAEQRLVELQAEVAAAREAASAERVRADQATAVAHERAAGAERRAALAIDAERTARAKADKRVESLERKLTEEADRAQSLQAQHAEQLGEWRSLEKHFNATVSRTQGELVQAQLALDDLQRQLVEAKRDAHAARRQVELAERVIASLTPRALRSAKPAGAAPRGSST